MTEEQENLFVESGLRIILYFLIAITAGLVFFR